MRPKPPSCTGCPLHTLSPYGFQTDPDGSGRNGVLLVGEALGADEEKVGKPFQGKAGLALVQMLQRYGLQRDEFLIDNVLRCRPPDNRLNGEPYEAAAVWHCRPHLDSSLNRPDVRVVVPMGDTAFRRVTGLDRSHRITKVRGYVWRAANGKWVLPTLHPAFIMRGQDKFRGVFVNDLIRAVRIAREGWTPHRLEALCDPDPLTASLWAAEYLRQTPLPPLAYDIETPMKGEEAEDELPVDDPSFLILRISFSWREGQAMSVPWTAAYLPTIRALLGSNGPKVVWNGTYDRPRVEAAGVPVLGEEWDMMWGWHILNSDLPKGLGFVAPFYCHDQTAWKHLSKAEPARYNAIDAEVELRCAEGILRDISAHGLDRVWREDIIEIGQIFRAMSDAGLPVDDAYRRTLSGELSTALAAVDRRLAEAVPLEARALKAYKTRPRDVTGCITKPTQQTWLECPACGLKKPPKTHFRVLKKKVNPCAGLAPRTVTGLAETWHRVLPWVPSVKQLTAYCTVRGYQPIVKLDRSVRPARRRVSFDDDALKRLIARHPDDRVFPAVRDRREVEKLLTTYVGVPTPEGGWDGGVPVWKDGRVHPTFTSTPSTLRSACVNPNMQNQPSRGEWAARIKRMYVAEPGYRLVEADYSAIEAVLVGYGAIATDPAAARDYIRLSKLGVHDYLNSHLLTLLGKIKEPADLSWSDADLRALFADLKARFPAERDTSKRVVHGSNYGMTPQHMAGLYPEIFPDRMEGRRRVPGWVEAKRVQDLYFAVCPAVRARMTVVVERAEKEGFLRNEFGYLHRFWRVKEWSKDDVTGEWTSAWGEDAKRALAFGPQSLAAAIIKQAMRKVKAAGLLHTLRLLVHDSLVLMVKDDEEGLEEARQVIRIMAEPIPQLPLDASWAMGPYLSIGVEAKTGLSWAGMEKFSWH